MTFTSEEWNMIKQCVEIANREFTNSEMKAKKEVVGNMKRRCVTYFRRQENMCLQILKKFENEGI